MRTEEERLEHRREYQREWRRKRMSEDREAHLLRCRMWHNKDIPAKINSLLASARKRARKKGLDFCITADDLEVPTHCPILDIELIYLWNTRKNKDFSPSIDRIDSSKGYVPGNVWIISDRANKIKNDSTPEELGKIYRAVKRKLKNARA